MNNLVLPLFTDVESPAGWAPNCSALSVLDVTMGHRGMQKEIKRFGIEGNIVSVDIRSQMTNGMKPDVVADSRALPQQNDSQDLVLFDPPFSFHGKKSCGNTEYNRFYVTYGLNLYTTRSELGDYIEKTFREIWRVLKHGGTCLLKWSESRIKLEWVLALKGELTIEKRWQRPSKHWGTKTGTATWYVWLNKPNDKLSDGANYQRRSNEKEINAKGQNRRSLQ